MRLPSIGANLNLLLTDRLPRRLIIIGRAPKSAAKPRPRLKTSPWAVAIVAVSRGGGRAHVAVINRLTATGGVAVPKPQLVVQENLLIDAAPAPLLAKSIGVEPGLNAVVRFYRHQRILAGRK